MKKLNVAVVGATGMVGRTFLKVLEEEKQDSVGLAALLSAIGLR